MDSLVRPPFHPHFLPHFPPHFPLRPPDLRHPGRRVPALHGAEHRGNAGGSGARQNADPGSRGHFTGQGPLPRRRYGAAAGAVFDGGDLLNPLYRPIIHFPGDPAVRRSIHRWP